MKFPLGAVARKLLRRAARSLIALLPREWRFALQRARVDCDPQPDARLTLKIADTQDELEACFCILHDAYVSGGFMSPDPSGLRVTAYHALPTTTTLCAKWDGRVVGTISMIREGVFGFPLQTAFNLAPLRARGGKIAEISALAVDPAFRQSGGKIVFPLMKFMCDYCLQYFDTRHLVIAVNPNKIEMYESLLFFERLQAEAVGGVVKNDLVANGAPAVAAALDLVKGQRRFEQAYGGQHPRKNLHRYFFKSRLTNIVAPQRPFFTTNDPVLTPAMMDYFFNRRTQVFAGLDDRQRALLRSIYDHAAYAGVVPAPALTAGPGLALRAHQRFSIRCPARLVLALDGARSVHVLQVIELSLHGFQAECALPLPEGSSGRVEIDLGRQQTTRVMTIVVRRTLGRGVAHCGFMVAEPDAAWRRCVAALQSGRTHADLLDTPADEGVDPANQAGFRRPRRPQDATIRSRVISVS